jgi:prophage regulatory protein
MFTRRWPWVSFADSVKVLLEFEQLDSFNVLATPVLVRCEMPRIQMQTTTIPESDHLMDLPAVSRLTTMKKTAIYSAIKAGRFPPPIRCGLRSVAWRASDVQRWISSSPAVSYQVPSANP